MRLLPDAVRVSWSNHPVPVVGALAIDSVLVAVVVGVTIGRHIVEGDRFGDTSAIFPKLTQFDVSADLVLPYGYVPSRTSPPVEMVAWSGRSALVHIEAAVLTSPLAQHCTMQAKGLTMQDIRRKGKAA